MLAVRDDQGRSVERDIRRRLTKDEEHREIRRVWGQMVASDDRVYSLREIAERCVYGRDGQGIWEDHLFEMILLEAMRRVRAALPDKLVRQ